jgi:hypothetical protein
MLLGNDADERYRTVEEPQIAQFLLMHGWSFEVRAGGETAALQQVRQTLDRAVELGLPFRAGADGQRRFDPAEVLNFLEWAALNGREPFWEARSVTTGRALIRAAYGLVGGGPPPTGGLGPRRFVMRFEREFNLQGRAPSSRVRLRAPLPLADENISDLEIELLPSPDFAADYAIAPGRLDAQLAVPAAMTATLSLESSFTACPVEVRAAEGPLAADELDLYTRPSEGLVQVSPRIRALAAELAGDERAPRTQIARFWNFMLGELACGAIHYDQLDPARPTDRPLETGWFDCQLGSALLVALCRSRGIPARMVSGYLLYPVAPGYHYWLEIWTAEQGWAPYDLLCWDLSRGGRDAEWRDYFFGRLDHRVTVERFPRLFSGAGAVRFPAAWHTRSQLSGEGTEIGYYDNRDGALIYRDRFSVRWVGEKAGAT